MDIFENSWNNLIKNYIATQIIYYLSNNIMNRYIKYINKK